MPHPDPLEASRTHRLRIGVGAAIVLLLVGIAIAVLVSAVSSAGNHDVTLADEPSVIVEPSAGTIYVHVLGEVVAPGLYELREGDRVVDAIAAAGGYTDAADREHQNLARFVRDGEQLHVLAEGEAPAAMPGAAGAAGVSGGLIDLNTADASALETLPRVGPALAQRIIRWRTDHGRFTSVDDLLAISGIGAKTLEQLRDLVTVR